MQKPELTSSIYTFENLIKGGFLYVDKTDFLWKLIRPANAMYFFARPRRFGKSLTVSTLKALFSGRRELFRGLAIDAKPYPWPVHPVIHLDIGNCDARTSAELHGYLHATLGNIAAGYGLTLRGETLSTDFQFLIEDLAKINSVVVLVDEYDKPILNNILNPAIMEILSVLKGFYSTIKTCEGRIRFAFVTGVTKFCHVSLFSDLNNLTDISQNPDFAQFLGYTQDEVEHYFKPWLDELETNLAIDRSRLLAKIKEWYDGYRFEESAACVYNPVSLAMFFCNGGKFRNYWFSTGTPAFLIDLMRQKKMALDTALTEPATSYIFGTFELNNIPPLTLLLQTGYVTIASTETQYGKTKYHLAFPNREVSESFNTYLLNAYTRQSENDVSNFCDRLADAMVSGNVMLLRKTLDVFFAGIPYDVHHKSEENFQNIFFAIFKLLGYNVQAESRTSDGRIDAIVETADFVYLFEFKLNSDESSMEQIKSKEYFKPYLLLHKRIFLIGVNFDTRHGCIAKWRYEEQPALT